MRSTLPPSPAIAPTVWSVSVPCEDARLPGKLTIPPQASALVLFAHGSGSSRHSPRNQFVADVLHQAGMATLLWLLELGAKHVEDLIEIKILMKSPRTMWHLRLRIVISRTFLVISQCVVGCLYLLEFLCVPAFVRMMLAG